MHFKVLFVGFTIEQDCKHIVNALCCWMCIPDETIVFAAACQLKLNKTTLRSSNGKWMHELQWFLRHLRYRGTFYYLLRWRSNWLCLLFVTPPLLITITHRIVADRLWIVIRSYFLWFSICFSIIWNSHYGSCSQSCPNIYCINNAIASKQKHCKTNRITY